MNTKAPLILIVEPSLLCARLMQILLSKFENYKVMHTTTAQKAIDISNELQPNLILTEMELGDMTGLEFAKQLRNNSNTQYIPILGLSANAYSVDIKTALQNGFDAYITKPYHLNDLYHGITTYINT